MNQTVIYLHGFASSPQSKKANLFRAPLEARGVDYRVPDLNVPDFEHLTLTAILSKIDEVVQEAAVVADSDITLIGSSLGGLAALHYLDRYRTGTATRVQRAVLLAPALDFFVGRENHMGSGWEERWKAAGSLPFFNHQVNRELPVHYGMVEDMRQYNSFEVQINQPLLIYHGIYDAVVDHQRSLLFAAAYPANITLHLVESDHELLDVTDTILEGILAFIGL